jgi:glycosyltransferase A (GT-A) superfamily protein (DUF2064 family)
MKTALVIMSKIPAAGKTKTRLMKILSPAECAEFHQACLRDLLNAALATGLVGYVYWAGSEIAEITPEIETEFVPNIISEIGPENKLQPKLESKNESKIEAKNESKLEYRIGAGSESKLESKLEYKPVAESESNLECKPESEHKSELDPELESKLESQCDYRAFLKSDLCRSFKWRIQEGNGLGQRMSKIVQEILIKYEAVLLIGADIPEIDSSLLLEAAAKLQHAVEVVLGPAEDGGYYLIGMKKHRPLLFQNITWSTGSVFQKTLERVNLKIVIIIF